MQRAVMTTAEAEVTWPSADDEAIDTLMSDLYRVISFEEDGEPDWARMAELFSPHARITRVTPEGIDYYDLAGFQDMARELVEVGVYLSFHEYELRRHVTVFGGVAHVLSAYATKQSKQASEPFARGLNSLQLVRELDGWRVLSLFWDEESERNPLDLDTLFVGARA